MTIETIKYNGEARERFVSTNACERDVIEGARSYFASSKLLLNVGLGRRVSTKCASSLYNQIKKGINSRGKKQSVSVEDWELIKKYFERFKKDERYNPQVFVLPVIESAQEY